MQMRMLIMQIQSLLGFNLFSLILNVQVDSSIIFHSLIIMTLDFVVGCKIPKQQVGYDDIFSQTQVEGMVLIYAHGFFSHPLYHKFQKSQHS